MRSHEARPHLYEFKDDDGKSIIVGGSININLLNAEEDNDVIIPIPARNTIPSPENLDDSNS